jgi:Serine/threonine protein kinase
MSLLQKPAHPTQPLKSSVSGSFKIICRIGNSKFPVFLINAHESDKTYAMKLYPYVENEVNPSFVNESRFLFLSHKNIVSIIRAQPKQKSSHKEKMFDSSYIIMEAAPYGDIARVLRTSTLFYDEKLARTYFHQLVEGIEYLHSQGVAHMDLKPENLLLGEDFILKITDFDCAYMKRDPEILGRGTRNYRAPEVIKRACTDPEAADIYSAGIILFVLVTGYFPYFEDSIVDNYNLEELLRNEDPKFWEFHMEIQPRKITFSDSFKTLFLNMVKEDVVERATLEEVKKSTWYNEPIYTIDETKEIFTEFFNSVKQG